MVCYIYCKINDRELMVNEYDPEDIRCFTGKKWRKIKTTKRGKAENEYKIVWVGKCIYLHRLNYYAHNQDWDIYDGSKNNLIDHIDLKKSNNHISNLRVVNQSQNNTNNNCKGCYWCNTRKKYISRIVSNGKTIYLGQYDTEEEARKCYLENKKIYHNII